MNLITFTMEMGKLRDNVHFPIVALPTKTKYQHEVEIFILIIS